MRTTRRLDLLASKNGRTKCPYRGASHALGRGGNSLARARLSKPIGAKAGNQKAWHYPHWIAHRVDALFANIRWALTTGRGRSIWMARHRIPRPGGGPRQGRDRATSARGAAASCGLAHENVDLFHTETPSESPSGAVKLVGQTERGMPSRTWTGPIFRRTGGLKADQRITKSWHRPESRDLRETRECTRDASFK